MSKLIGEITRVQCSQIQSPSTKACSNALYVYISVIKDIAGVYKLNILWMLVAILIPERVVDPGVWDREEL